MTEDCRQVTYVIVIPADMAPEAAEALTILQAIQLPLETPTVTSCSHSRGQSSADSQALFDTGSPGCQRKAQIHAAEKTLLYFNSSRDEEMIHYVLLLRHGTTQNTHLFCTIYSIE